MAASLTNVTLGLGCQMKHFQHTFWQPWLVLGSVAWGTTVLCAYLFITRAELPRLIEDWPAWVQIDCVPIMVTAAYFGNTIMILIAANRTTMQMQRIKKTTGIMSKTCVPNLSWRLHGLMVKDMRPVIEARMVAEFGQMESILEQVIDEHGGVFAFLPIGRVTTGRMSRILYLSMVPVLYLLQNSLK